MSFHWSPSMTVRNRNSVSFRRSVFSCLTAGLRSCPLKNTVLVRHAWAVSIPMGAAQNPQLLAIYSWVPNSAHPERGSSCRAREYVVPSRWRQGVAGDRTRGERRPEGRTPEGGQCRCDDRNRGAQVVAKRCELLGAVLVASPMTPCGVDLREHRTTRAIVLGSPENSQEQLVCR